MQDLDEYFSATTHAQDFDRLKQASIEFFGSCQISVGSYHHFPPRGAHDYGRRVTIAMAGYPHQWIKEYIDNRYFEHDPIVERARNSLRPFWWSSIEQDKIRSSSAARLMERMKEFSNGFGASVPVFAPNDRIGYFGLVLKDGQHGMASSYLNQIQWACQMTHLRFVELLTHELPSPANLSQRETQALKLVASGLSNSEIANNLNVSSHTVNTFLVRSFDKLGVHDRVTAALRALATGAIE